MQISLREITAGAKAYVCYKLPQSKQIQIIVSEELPHTAHTLSELELYEGFLFAPFVPSEETPYLLIQGKSSSYEVEQLSNVASSNRLLRKDDSKSLEDYRQDFDQFIAALKSKRFDKLVLARQELVDLEQAFQGDALFLKACRHYPEAFVYQLFTPQTGLWLGASPELLLSCSPEGACRTVSLAGTQQQDNEAAWTSKNTIEQAIVTDYISYTLQASGISFERSEPYSFGTAELLHLKTDFSFQVESSCLLHKLIEALHPTPAVCGFPKEAAQAFIVAHEQQARQYYSGFMGPKDQSGVQLYVNLRCLQVQPHTKQVRLFAGGGLLASSQLEEEWLETKQKMQTLVSLI